MTALLAVTDLVKTFPVAAPGGGWRDLLGRRRSLLRAVDGVTFSVDAGESVGLVGESGCGKSTLTRLLARLIDPTAGTIRFDGADIGGVPAERFAGSADRRRIQMVFQDAPDSLNPRFTAFQSIADPVRRLGRGGAVTARVEEAARRVGLPPELLRRFPHQLSGGQQARVGIARGIVLEPELLILDEPTSSLDVSVQAVILALLVQLRRDLGLTCLFVSHDLNVVRLMCERVLVMYLGQIVESGSAEALFRRPAHPYTEALLSAVPRIDPASRRSSIRLDGEPASPIDVGHNSCLFAGRCPRAQDRCRQEMPVLLPLAAGRSVACHFPLGPG